MPVLVLAKNDLENTLPGVGPRDKGPSVLDVKEAGSAISIRGQDVSLVRAEDRMS